MIFLFRHHFVISFAQKISQTPSYTKLRQLMIALTKFVSFLFFGQIFVHVLVVQVRIAF
ncbi:hypothetical protein CFter6_3369 [Collimonas fungivorans]|uniref:Uncharacterized protein n=1 Tax=Collimonas fungivorans TaxID=158899 RepID=A0A127PE65_9BURK|nr:hypothetical protein CFter6_3369 [Collimonas fungivorans]